MLDTEPGEEKVNEDLKQTSKEMGTHIVRSYLLLST